MFQNRGEIIGINARAYAGWKTSPPDLIDSYVFNIAIDPAQYTQWGAEAAYPGSASNKPAPIDLLNSGPLRVLLHEVSHFAADVFVFHERAQLTKT